MTIVVLIILATVSINVVLGENGLIRQAEKASQYHANGVASEQDALDTLLEEYANALAGEGNGGNNGDDGDNGGTQTPTEPLQITYTIEDIDEGSKAVILSYPEELNPTEEELDPIAVDAAVANNIGTTIDDFWSFYMGSATTKVNVKSMIEAQGMTYEEVLLGLLRGLGLVSNPITVTATNGTHQIEGETTEFIATRNGTYTVEVTANDGREEEIEVNVTGIEEEKFSEIYNETTTYTEGTKTAKIPAGFAVGVSEGINTIAGGLVITDAVDENGYSIGNEFVWIPVESDETFIRESFDASATLSTSYTEPFNYNDGTTTYTGYSTEEAEYNTMRTQVIAHHGFYIGRYEAGVNTATKRARTTEAQTVVVKKGTAPYNFVPWGTSMSEIGTNGAVYLAQNMYTGKTQASSVTSTLIYGVQWDAMCRYITDYTRTTSIKANVDLTGRVGGDNSKNIYDLAGNCFEWTMEASGIHTRVYRGGCYGSESPVSNRNYNVPTNLYNSYSFRYALYVK